MANEQSDKQYRSIPADRIERLLELVSKACRDAAVENNERAYELWTAVRRELQDAPTVPSSIRRTFWSGDREHCSKCLEMLPCKCEPSAIERTPPTAPVGKPDPSKRCGLRFRTDCPNMKMREGDTDMTGENYECKVCGDTMFLDYEEMK